MKKIEIIKNKKTKYHICMDQNGASASRYGCRELQKYIYDAADVCIPVFSDKCEKRGPEILVGNARGALSLVDTKPLGEEGYLVTSHNDDILILGNTPRAILYGVYAFLEEYVGFRCFTSEYEKVDRVKKMIFNHDIKGGFDFEYREVYFTDAFDGAYCAKNMLNSNLSFLSENLGGKMKWYNFHHSFSDLVSPMKYFDKHPEYFSLIDGKRRKVHTELCLSNPEVFKIALDGVFKWIEDNPDCKIFSVSQDEWMGHFVKLACECDECRKVDEEEESQSGSIVKFVNKIAREVAKKYPDKMIHTFAYQYSRKPPKNIIPLENIIIRLTNIECSWGMSIQESAIKNPLSEEAKFLDDLKKWSLKTKHLYIWDYAVNYRNYLLPFPNIRSMAKNIELYKKIGVKGILMQGNFSYGKGGYMDELKAYLSARLFRCESMPMEEIVREFCDGYYGKAGQYIYDYIFAFEDAGYGKRIWLYDDSDHEMFTDELVARTKVLIDKAVNASTKETKKRIQKVKLSWDYMHISRLPLEDITRSAKIKKFKKELKELKITEIFERTELEYSLKVLETSRYCKDRKDWYSLYYIMK